MIHPYALLLGGLLTSSAVLGGHLPAAVLLAWILLLRDPRGPTPPTVLLITVLFALLQLVATLVINLAARFSQKAWDATFGEHRVIVESIGIYEVGDGTNGLIVAGACVPSGLLLLYVLLAWKKLTRRNPMKRMRPLLTTMGWALTSVAAALVAPTVLGGVLLVIGMIAFLCVTWVGDRLFFGAVGPRRGRLRLFVLYLTSLSGVIFGCLILVTTCVSQNAFVAHALRDVDTMYGVSRLYELQVNIAVRRFIQVCLMMTTLCLAQMAMVCHWECLQWNRTNVPFLQETVPGALSNSSRSSTEVVFNDGNAALADAPNNNTDAVDNAVQNRSSGARRIPGNRSAASGANSCEQLPPPMGFAGASIMRGFLACSRLVPLILMATNMIAFPTVASLCMLPTMMAGQLMHRRSFGHLLRPTLALSFLVVSLQYVVFVTEVVQPDIMLRLFFSDANIWARLAQLICGELLFLAMITADIAFRYRAYFAPPHPVCTHAPLIPLPAQPPSTTTTTTPRLSSSSPPHETSNGVSLEEHNNPNENGNAGSNNNNNEAVSEHDEMLGSAKQVLGEERVAELLAYVPPGPLDSQGAFEELFYRLTGRYPTAEESESLCKDKIGDSLLLEKMHESKQPLLLHYAHWAKILFRQQAVLVVLLMLFVAGSFIYYMDIIHAIVLVLFAVYILVPGIIDDKWVIVVLGLILLASFELVFTFASEFFSLPIYVGDGPLEYATIGFVPRRARYESIPSVVAVFVVAFLYLNARPCRSWGVVVSLHEWERFCGSTAARQWSMRITMTIATTVFVAFGVFLRASLIVEGFLGLFLVLAIATAFLGVTNSLLGALWCLACVYSGIVVWATTLCQFTQFTEVLQEYVFEPLCGDSSSQCRRETGLYRTDEDMLLTFFLAPWFLALATTISHLATKSVRNVKPRWVDTDGERGSVVENMNRSSGADAALPSLASNDQRFLRHFVKLLAVMDTLSDWATSFSADYGDVVVWVALFVAATHRYTAMSAVYILFFFLDFTHVSVLIYCVLHILVVYTYKFSFVPEITYQFRGVSLAKFIGLEKEADTLVFDQVIGPVLVFFAVLLRIHNRGANKEIRRRQRTEGPESSNWRSVLCTQVFFYVGYEAFLLTLLIVLALSGDSCVGVVVALALVLLLMGGRHRFHHAMRSLVLLVLVTISLIWLYALEFNVVQNVFPVVEEVLKESDDENKWAHWVFATHWDALIGCFIGIMLLHTNRQQAADTNVSFAVIRAEFGGHSTLVDYIRAARVKSLRRLSQEEFERAVPQFNETLPRSVLGRITTFMIFVVTYTYPVPLFSFAAGVSSQPSLINLVLLVAAVLQVALFEELHWRFFHLWLPIAGMYTALVCLPSICNTPYVRQFLRDQRTLSGVIGVAQAGHIFELGPLHVLLLFFVALQTRIFSDFRYVKMVRRLYRHTARLQVKHDELWAWIRAKEESEEQLAVARSRALHAKLDEIRCIKNCAEGTWDPEEILIDTTPSAVVSAPASASDFGHPTHIKRRADTAGLGASGQHKQYQEMANDSGGETCTPPSSVPTRTQRFMTLVRRASLSVWSSIIKYATKMADWLAAHTYKPDNNTAAHYRNLGTRLIGVTIRAVERHTSLLALLVTMINFMLTRCAWDMVPFCFILVVANTCGPFAPRYMFAITSYYVALGILLKAVLGIIVSQVAYSPRLFDFVSWTFLDVKADVYWKHSIGYSYVMTDFIVFAVLYMHQEISLYNGVYSPKDILESRGMLQPPTPTPTQPVVDDATVGVAVDVVSHPRVSSSPTSNPLEGTDDIVDSEATAAGEEGQQMVARGAGDSSSPPLNIPSHFSTMRRKTHKAVVLFVRNAIRTPGVGRDWYIYYLTVDAIALVTFVVGYNKMSGGTEANIQQSLERNLLPGPLVMVVLFSILLMIADRMLYVARHMPGKLVLNTLCGIAYSVCFLVWGNLVVVESRAVGNLYFVLKILALTISVLQVRVGFPRHRRHDPFTCTRGRSTVAQLGYQLYRAVPFLWEVRVVTDWTVERTALSLSSYLKIEDLYDIVFGRQSDIGDTRKPRPVVGSAVGWTSKLSDGVACLAVFVVVLVAPLLYYSTFNPSMQINNVTELRVGLSIMSSQRYYTSTVFKASTYPADWALWLARTRPSLAQEGLLDPNKALQLLELSSCSNDLWPISPQAFRQLQDQLQEVAENKTKMYMYQSLEFSHFDSADSVTRTSKWNIPWQTADGILQMMNAETVNETEFVLLQNFYTPFLFSREQTVDEYDFSKGLNGMDCSLQLRREVDPVLNNSVRYWCLKCQSLFTGGNIPGEDVALFPEWDCLSKGEGCSNFDFERHNGDTNYNPVTMYYVVLSDPSASGVSFLQGIGIVALYTTFVLAVGHFFRGIFAEKAKHIILTDMADPTPVAQLIEYIGIARECGDLRLEQSVYFELVDLLRSPERLLRLTGYSRKMYATDTTPPPPPPPPPPSQQQQQQQQEKEQGHPAGSRLGEDEGASSQRNDAPQGPPTDHPKGE